MEKLSMLQWIITMTQERPNRNKDCFPFMGNGEKDEQADMQIGTGLDHSIKCLVIPLNIPKFL